MVWRCDVWKEMNKIHGRFCRKIFFVARFATKRVAELDTGRN
jgi:hypothetical protein